MNAKHRHPARIPAVLLAAALAGPRVQAQAPRVDRAEIIDFGIYTFTPTGTNSAPDAVGGKDQQVEDLRLAARTHTIPLEKGVAFGYRFKLVGSPADAKVPLRAVILFPPGGLTNTALRKHYDRSSVDFTASIGSVSVRGYSLDDPWDLVPGTWTMQLWQGDRKLNEEVFTLAKR
jgi:Domain of unknown function (DUF3859)